MPKITWPNRVTITRILLIAPFVTALLYLCEPGWEERARWLAMVVFALMAISDGLDGYLARRLKQESALGRLLDPLADKLLVLCSVVLLAHEGTHVSGMLLPAWVAVMAMGKDLIVVVGFCVVYLVTSRVYIEPRPIGKWCTTMQLLMVIAILLSPDLPGRLQVLPAVLWWVATGLAAAAILDYYRIGIQFIDEHEKALEAAGESDSPVQ